MSPIVLSPELLQHLQTLQTDTQMRLARFEGLPAAPRRWARLSPDQQNQLVTRQQRWVEFCPTWNRLFPPYHNRPSRWSVAFQGTAPAEQLSIDLPTWNDYGAQGLGSWYNVDQVLSEGMEAQRFLDKVVLVCPHLSTEELKRLPILCVSTNTNAVQRLNYSKPFDAHIMDGLWAYTTDHQFTLLAYVQKGEDVFFEKKDILVGGPEQLHQIVLKPATLEVVRGILSKYGNPRPGHELNDLYDHLNPCCHDRYPSDVGM